MYDFLKQFESKNEKSLLGKIVNKIRKRDDKAIVKEEELMSDFDYWQQVFEEFYFHNKLFL